MTTSALRALASDLAALGYNTLIMEWEASFPYRKHATVSSSQAYSPEEVRDFLALCVRMGLEVIPLQQTLGHLEHILRHGRYSGLREDAANRCQLCPCKLSEAKKLVRELVADIMEYHSGPWIHLGGDEAYLLGHCPECRAFVKKESLGALYARYYSAIIQEVKRMGLKPVLWADMLLKHPENRDLLPKDTVIIDWNYGWNFNRFGDPKTLVAAGYTVWGAVALRSSPDNHSLTWWERHLKNFRNFIPFAVDTGYSGMILTSWSTSGMFGYSWENDVGGRVIDLHPIRRVYPLDGHRVLLKACSEAMDQKQPIASRGFLKRYAERRFGLTARGAARFAEAILRQDPRFRPVAKNNSLTRLRPRRNAREFSILTLMEEFYTLNADVDRVERAYQSKNYTRSEAVVLLKDILSIKHRSDRLEVLYQRLHAPTLHELDIRLDREYRTAKLSDLHARIERQSQRFRSGRGAIKSSAQGQSSRHLRSHDSEAAE